MGKKKRTSILILGVVIITGILIGVWCTCGSRIYSESQTEPEPVEKLAKELFIKEINVYEDHIIVQIDKDLATSEDPYFMSQAGLFTENEYTFQARQREFEQTGRIELQIGEAIVMPIAYSSYFAFLREIKDGIAYMDVEVIKRASEMVSGVPMEPEEISKEEYTVEVDKEYKRPENKQ